MIKFFRRIRKSLTLENSSSESSSAGKISKYLLYAVGEIILVVFGILIALNVNNRNERIKKEGKIVETLKEIHQELSDDIFKCNVVLENYKHEDSLVRIVMSEQFTIEDLKRNGAFYHRRAGVNWWDTKINTNGFNSLMDISDDLPEKYESVLKALKKLYVDDKSDLDRHYDIAFNTVSAHWYYLKDNTKWFGDLYYHNNLTDDAIDFYLNESYYSNYLALYQAGTIGNHCVSVFRFRKDAEETYEKLTEVLELEKLISKDSTYFNVNVKDYDHFLGTYEDGKNKALISVDSHKLYFQRNDGEKVRIYPTSNTSFIYGRSNRFNNIVLDSLGNTESYNWHYSRSQGSMMKID